MFYVMTIDVLGTISLKQSLTIKSIQNNTKSGIIFQFYQSLNYNEPE